MSERERLIEILNNAPFGYEQLGQRFYKHILENIADYLLENGVIVLPAKVGDTLYITNEELNIIDEETVRTFFIGHPSYNGDMPCLKMIRTNKHDIPIEKFGKTVFLTKEQAEKALKGGAE